MTKQEKMIWESVKSIEKWAGDAYHTPTTDPRNCPYGDDIYQSLEKIKKVINLDLCIACGEHIESDGVDLIFDNKMIKNTRLHTNCLFRMLRE